MTEPTATRTFRLTLAYDGSAYFGWQQQIGQRTIQGELNATLARVTGHAVHTLASGRTDTGVHALGQVVGARLQTRLTPAVIRRACNAELPDDIAVLEATEVDKGFHPIGDAAKKRYRYVIFDGPVRDVFRRRYCWEYRGGRLDDGAMAAAAQTLLGTHDFCSFATAGSPRKSTVRTIYDISVDRGRAGEWPLGFASGFAGRPLEPVRETPVGDSDRGPDSSPGDWIVIEVEANGFLYNMVRTIVGTLVEVGRGGRAVDYPGKVVRAADRRAAGRTAPPQGLYLLHVTYRGDPQ
ncbi:MAG: tRNA pseudouridine synthase A [Planctomycetota bacterium]